jgi:hypothetical protein
MITNLSSPSFLRVDAGHARVLDSTVSTDDGFEEPAGSNGSNDTPSCAEYTPTIRSLSAGSSIVSIYDFAEYG